MFSPEFQKAVDLLLNSLTLARSSTHKKLLQYLVSCYIKGVSPTEQDIAINVYEREQKFNPAEDTIVRVGIYKLRKKLEQYYKIEGKAETVRITIPKGHYCIEFQNEKQSAIFQKIKNQKRYWAVLCLLCILMGIVIAQNRTIGKLQQHLENFHFLKTDAPVWSSFFNNDLLCILTVGDFYIFEQYEKELDYNRRVMDYFINSDQEFDQYILQHNFPPLKKLPIGEIPHQSIYNIKDLAVIFHSFQKDYAIEMSSAFDLNNTRDHNIVYIGDFKSLRLLKGLITRHDIHFENTDGFSGKLTVHDKSTDSTLVFDCSNIDLSKESKSLDYGILLKDKGPNQENYLFIIGFGYTSQLETVHMLADESRLGQFAEMLPQKNGKIADKFLAVTQVTGLYMTPYDIEIVYVSEL